MRNAGLEEVQAGMSLRLLTFKVNSQISYPTLGEEFRQKYTWSDSEDESFYFFTR